MKLRTKIQILMVSVISFAAVLADAKVDSSSVRIRTGDMRLMSYLENLSDTLEIAISSTDLSNGGPEIHVSFGGPMTREQALVQAHSLLSMQGFALIYQTDLDAYRLMRLRDARDSNVPLIADASALPEDDSIVTHLIRLKHFPAEMIARNIRSVAPPAARIVPDEANNALYVTDSSRSIKKYRSIAFSLDTPNAALEAKEMAKRRSKNERCDDAAPAADNTNLFIALFASIGVILGFLVRGYMIRRIEGGL